MKVYISGATTGIPAKIVSKQFKSAETELRNMEFFPVNPLNNGLDKTASWLEHMKADIRLLLDCDAIYMLVGWEDSKGAIIEKQLAQKLGLKVFYEKQNNKNTNQNSSNNESKAIMESIYRFPIGYRCWIELTDIITCSYLKKKIGTRNRIHGAKSGKTLVVRGIPSRIDFVEVGCEKYNKK